MAADGSIWVHSSVVRAADCRSAGPWFKSGCALLLARLQLWQWASREQPKQCVGPGCTKYRESTDLAYVLDVPFLFHICLPFVLHVLCSCFCSLPWPASGVGGRRGRAAGAPSPSPSPFPKLRSCCSAETACEQQLGNLGKGEGEGWKMTLSQGTLSKGALALTLTFYSKECAFLHMVFNKFTALGAGHASVHV